MIRRDQKQRYIEVNNRVGGGGSKIVNMTMTKLPTVMIIPELSSVDSFDTCGFNSEDLKDSLDTLPWVLLDS